MRSSARVGEIARVLWIGALAALPLPGVRAARAEADLVPPVSELFSWKSQARPSAPASCAAGSEASLRLREARRQAALARIAELVKAAPGGEVQALDGRGYAYPVPRDPYREILMVEMEAQRQRALRAAGVR